MSWTPCAVSAARRAARTDAAIVAVTGSVGKTGTKEALRLAFARQGRTHASVASYNNHWGVPLTLARMPPRRALRRVRDRHEPCGRDPAADRDGPSARRDRHHGRAGAYRAFFPSIWGIADAKGEIFSGLEPGGVAIVPTATTPQFERLLAHALASSAGRVVTFGEHGRRTCAPCASSRSADVSIVDAVVFGRPVTYRIGTPGRHIALNSLAVLAAVARPRGATSARPRWRLPT